MKTVFEPFELEGITFSNKIIRSATFEGVGDENIETLKKLTKRMHEMETPIIAQLNHCGGQSKEESAHMPIVAPSKISDYKVKRND